MAIFGKLMKEVRGALLPLLLPAAAALRLRLRLRLQLLLLLLLLLLPPLGRARLPAPPARLLERATHPTPPHPTPPHAPRWTSRPCPPRRPRSAR
jgi:hypothetical protein